MSVSNVLFCCMIFCTEVEVKYNSSRGTTTCSKQWIRINALWGKQFVVVAAACCSFPSSSALFLLLFPSPSYPPPPPPILLSPSPYPPHLLPLHSFPFHSSFSPFPLPFFFLFLPLLFSPFSFFSSSSSSLPLPPVCIILLLLGYSVFISSPVIRMCCKGGLITLFFLHLSSHGKLNAFAITFQPKLPVATLGVG